MAALPFRLKAGASQAGAASEGHQHRSTTKSSHKPFKSRHASKNFLRTIMKGKIEKSESSHRRTPQKQVASKLDRRNQARQKQKNKNREHAKAASIFTGRGQAPKIVALIPLCPETSPAEAVKALNSSIDIELEVPAAGLVTANIDRFKQKIEYILVQRDLIPVLDAARIADFVVFLVSPDLNVGEYGNLLMKAVKGQGVSNVFIVVQGLDSTARPKKRPQVLSTIKSYMSAYFPAEEDPYPLDSRQECLGLIRSLCAKTPKGVHWREDRSWMLVEDVRWPELEGLHSQDNIGDEDKTEVVLTGVVRGKGLKADRLVQLADWGVYQIEKITAAPVDRTKATRKRDDAMKTEEEEEEGWVLDQPTENQENLAELAPVELRMADTDEASAPPTEQNRRGVLLDDHYYFSDEETHIAPTPKRLPKGTSSYQAAWILDDVSGSESDVEDVDEDGDLQMDANEESQHHSEGFEPLYLPLKADTAPSEAAQSEMFLDRAPEEEIEHITAFRARRKDETKEDLEFPDEIELHPNVLARECLAKYRGLKSLRTSLWDTNEDSAREPEDLYRLLQVANYKGARNRALRGSDDGAPPGRRVHVHVRNIPLSLRNSIPTPFGLYSLLPHEQKQTVLNFNVTLDSRYPSSIKSKEELILQYGPRRIVINPLFSHGGQTPNNVHKYDRYLHPGRSAVATFIGPMIWGPVPALLFRKKSPSDQDPRTTTAKNDTEDEVMNNAKDELSAEYRDSDHDLELIGTGTCLPPDLDRVIAKRVILTGHPYKIHKNVVTVRYMFFNAEDVRWFKALPLWTRKGRRGFIKESLGTHGYFKATFDARINPQDAVCVSLYKRMFPTKARPWRPEE